MKLKFDGLVGDPKTMLATPRTDRELQEYESEHWTFGGSTLGSQLHRVLYLQAKKVSAFGITVTVSRKLYIA
jgi:hypothetical protein